MLLRQQRFKIGIGISVAKERLIGSGVSLPESQRVQELYRPVARTLARCTMPQYSTFLQQALPEKLGAGEGSISAFAPSSHHQHRSVQ